MPFDNDQSKQTSCGEEEIAITVGPRKCLVGLRIEVVHIEAVGVTRSMIKTSNSDRLEMENFLRKD